MSTQKLIWQYSERILTGWTILAIGTIGATLGDILNNPLAVAFGIFAIILGTHRLGHAHGMRDMHCIDQKIPPTKRLKDFSIHAEIKDPQ
jgi:hypothetical protein